MPPLLEVRDLVKTFPGVRALDGARLTLAAGEIHALLGENGAGKSTLISILAGVQRADSGTLLLDGKELTRALGISFVFQELSLVPSLSIAENVFANRQPGRFGMIASARMGAETLKLLDLFEWRVDPFTSVRRLSAAQRQRVEILKALSQDPRILVLDEPTSSLTAVEAHQLFGQLRKLRERGLGIVYVSHHLGEILELCDRATVLRDGRTVATVPLPATGEAELVRLMVGRELKDVYGRRTAAIGPPLLEVQGKRPFTLHRGEILGLAGLIGSGRTRLARCLFGLAPAGTGPEILLEGRPVRFRNPREAIASGMGYLSEDRKEEGLFQDHSIRFNAPAPLLSRFASRLGWMRDDGIAAFAEDCRERFAINAPSTEKRVRLLSGGNQQKLLLGIWVGTSPKVLLVDEPTRGVDVGARSEIYRHLRALAESGTGILLVSSDLPEVLGMSDRVLVMRQGGIAGELSRPQATEERVIALAAGTGRGP